MAKSRRDFLRTAGSASLLSVLPGRVPALAQPAPAAVAKPFFQRVRPSDAAWPSAVNWESLRGKLKGELIKVESPLKACVGKADDAACAKLFTELKNPYYIGDHVALTQTLGWADAWTSEPSAFAVAAQSAADVAAAVDFAREHKLRLSIKGGGHSYFGNSNAPDSLLIWTRRMNDILLHDAFVGENCAGRVAAHPAVSVGAGAIWMHVYEAVMAKAGRYVQGGGCATVGVAGLIQSGGFGSFSKKFGTAASSLLEAEVVTADGKVRIANACTNSDLFWGLKGGGGGSLGVVTRLTLATYELPNYLGGVFATLKAESDVAFRELVGRVVDFYASNLLNPAWGEKIVFRANRTVSFGMTCQGLEETHVRAIWQPLFDWAERTAGISIVEPPKFIVLPGRQFFDPAVLKTVPGMVIADDRPDATPNDVFWSGDRAEAGQFLQAYHSAWLPAKLLEPDQRASLVDMLCAAAAQYGIALHFNKGLSGSAGEVVERARDTAMNPAVLEAFALAIVASHTSEPAYPGIPGHEPDLATARENAAKVGKAMQEVYRLVPKSAAGAYVSESDYFDADWQQSYWGTNYPRLLAIKKRYDPQGLFFAHNGVGAEGWSRDGFTRERA